MKKTFAVLFLVVVFGICLTPLIWMLADEPVAAKGRETLTAKPVLFQNGTFNVNFLADACDYFADHFGARYLLITADAKLEATVFHESASEDVILGSDGWLYYEPTLDDYQGTDPMSERELQQAVCQLMLIREYAETRGLRFLFTIVPNKNTLYPEQMPDRFTRSTAPGNMDRLAGLLQRADIPYLDLRSVFAAEADMLYYETDSHWNVLGAALAYDAAMTALDRNETKRYDPAQYTTVKDYSGDLYRMLYPAGTETELRYVPNRTPRFIYTKPFGSVEDQRIETENPDGSGSLLLFRDSFGNTLYPFLADAYETACISRAMPYDLTLIDQSGADTLLVEIVERNLIWLSQRAAIMQAPERALELPELETVVQAEWNGSVHAPYYCIQGEICEPIDADSGIYILADGMIYEATPAGNADGSFTAYLPEKPSEMHLIYYHQGHAVLSQPLYEEENLVNCK